MTSQTRSTLLSSINSNIITNDNKAITATILNTILVNMADSMLTALNDSGNMTGVMGIDDVLQNDNSTARDLIFEGTGTSVVLTDASGVKWRLSASTSGTLVLDVTA